MRRVSFAVVLTVAVNVAAALAACCEPADLAGLPAEELLRRAGDVNTSDADRQAIIKEMAGRGESTAPILVQKLTHPNVYVVNSVVSALTQMGSPAVDSLLAVTSDPNPVMRGRAIGVLVSIGDPRASDVFAKSLSDPWWAVRAGAASGLAKLGGSQALTSLLTALSDPDRDVRRSAAVGLATLGDPSAIGGLVEALSDPDYSVRGAAGEALTKSGTPAAHAIAAAMPGMKPPGIYVACRALGAIRGSEAEAALMGALDSGDWALCAFAAAGLGQSGGQEAADALRGLLASEQNAFVKSQINAALDAIAKRQQGG